MLGRLRDLRRDLGLMEIVVGLALGFALADLIGAISATTVEFWRYTVPPEEDVPLGLEGLFSRGWSIRIGDRYLDFTRVLEAILQGVLILLAALILWPPDDDNRPSEPAE